MKADRVIHSIRHTTPRLPSQLKGIPNDRSVTKTINRKASYILCLVIAHLAASNQAHADPFPRFRNLQAAQAPADVAGLKLRLLSDAAFPPYSYLASDGLQKGIAVDLAKAACQKLRITCEIRMLPFDQLLPQLAKNEGDIIVSGLRVTPDLVARANLTRAYYVSSGRFLVKQGSKFKDTSTPTLSGSTIGFVKDTTHARFIERYYPRAKLQPFANTGEVLNALKSGGIDAAFGDTMQFAFWLKGTASAKCCLALGKPFLDHETFSQNLVFVLPKNRQSVREAFDAALDQLEAEGVTAEIFGRYVPDSLW